MRSQTSGGPNATLNSAVPRRLGQSQTMRIILLWTKYPQQEKDKVSLWKPRLSVRRHQSERPFRRTSFQWWPGPEEGSGPNLSRTKSNSTYDISIQRLIPFQVTKCDPSCKNGGVCQNGICKCSKMYFGDSCENKVESSGAFTVFLFIFLVALVIVGIMLLRRSDNYQQEIRNYFRNQN